MKKIFRFAVCVLLCAALLTANLCVASAAGGFFAKAEMLKIKNHIEDDAGLDRYATVQGACTDGKFAYFAAMQGGATILKYDIRTWEFVEKKRISNVGHANDMAYNSKENVIVIANNAPYYEIVTLLNPDTLEVIRDVELEEDIYSIAYNAKRDQYVVGISGSYDYALLNHEFEVVEKFEGVGTGYTRQGCDCDDDYVYFIQSGGKNNIAVYDYEGNHIANIPMSNSDEAENIFHVGGEFYATMYYYGNTLHRIGFSDKSRIGFTVSYEPNGGEGEMKPTAVHYGEETKLRKNSYTRDGFFFAGWRAQRDSDGKIAGYRIGESNHEWLNENELYNDALYEDEAAVSKTVKFGGVRMSAVWIAEHYAVDYDSDGGEGDMASSYPAYAETITVPESGFTKEGYVFEGYTAVRDYDGRTYGYRTGSDQPEWLESGDVDRIHYFRPGDEVSKLTYDGSVIMTARFKFAYTFEDDGATLVEYVGVDEKVSIPSNSGELKTLAEGAIKDNEVMTELYIPAGVSSLQKDAVTNCPKLKNIYFEGSLPQSFDNACVQTDDTQVVYEMHNGQAFCIGFYADSHSAALIRCHASKLEEAIRTHRLER